MSAARIKSRKQPRGIIFPPPEEPLAIQAFAHLGRVRPGWRRRWRRCANKRHHHRCWHQL
eukprot:756909-Prymnesium_polylepis.1